MPTERPTLWQTETQRDLILVYVARSSLPTSSGSSCQKLSVWVVLQKRVSRSSRAAVTTHSVSDNRERDVQKSAFARRILGNFDSLGNWYHHRYDRRHWSTTRMRPECLWISRRSWCWMVMAGCLSLSMSLSFSSGYNLLLFLMQFSILFKRKVF